MEMEETKSKTLKTSKMGDSAIGEMDDEKDEFVAARQEFNIHFVTFWHLTYLATVFNQFGPTLRNWKMMNKIAKVWKKGLSLTGFRTFNNRLSVMLIFMDQSADRNKSLDEKTITIIQNLDKSLNIVKTSKHQLKHNRVNSIAVCAEMIQFCSSVNILADFKLLPLSWNYLFVSQIHQLLLLAQACYSPNELQKDFEQLFEEHAKFTNNLREHFSKSSINLDDSKTSTDSSSTSLTSSTSSKWLQPTVPLQTLIATLNTNAKCITERVPTALTAIVNEYCHFDPFNVNDFEFVKMNVVGDTKDD